MPRLQKLHDALKEAGFAPSERLGELTIEVPAADYLGSAGKLRDMGFEQLIDLCGVDYAAYGERPREGPRFAAVVHLLSVIQNVRVRVRSFCPQDDFPVLPSLVEVWPAANWFEREAFEDARMKFDVRYYLVAILFILFDLEIAFLFPWAVVINDIGLPGFLSMMLFLVILTVGFVYEWMKGALEWE